MSKIEVTAEMLRAAQLNTEVGTYITANWSGAYDCLTELFEVMLAAAPQQQAQDTSEVDRLHARVQELEQALATREQVNSVLTDRVVAMEHELEGWEQLERTKELKQDAARYRYLRDELIQYKPKNYDGGPYDRFDLYWQSKHEADLDAAIDAAMKEQS